MSDHNVLATWEADFTTLVKPLQSLFGSVAMQAAASVELESGLQREITRSAMWRESYEEERLAKEALKISQRELSQQVERLTQKNVELTNEIAVLNGRGRQLREANNALQMERGSLHKSSFSMVLIDGDGLIFEKGLLTKGVEGGKEAAQKLRVAVKELLAAVGEDAVTNIRVQVFFNKLGLGRVLGLANMVSLPILEQFVGQINDPPAQSTEKNPVHFTFDIVSAHHSTAVIDVGAGKEAADAKIRDGLSFCADLPQCKLVILGASHDNGYSTVLRSLETEGKLEKVRILKGYHMLAQELEEFKGKIIEIPGLFMVDKIHLPVVSMSPSVDSPKPIASRASSASIEPPSFLAVARAAPAPNAVPTAVDSFADGPVAVFKPSAACKASKERIATTAIYAQSIRALTPRPCHIYYLRGQCAFGGDCNYGHDYDLTERQLEELRGFAKKIPCQFWLKEYCAFGEDCLNGHECPYGTQCHYSLNCHFKKWHDEVRGVRAK